MEFLSEGHRYRVLQLGTTHFQDVLELNRFTLEALAQLMNCIHQFYDGGVHRDAETGRVSIVGGLTFVNMIVRIQILIFAFLMSHQFEANVRQHFVGVHVNGCARAALVYVNRELIHAFAVVQDFITCRNNRVSNAFWNGLEFFVCQRSGFLHHHHTANKLRDITDFTVADVEVFNRSQSMNAIVRVRRDFPCT